MADQSYRTVQCPIPECEHDLHLIWTISRPIYRADIDPGRAAIPEGGDVSHWEVGCEEGHVVMVPSLLTCVCEDYCSCDRDAGDEVRTFRASDGARLAALVGDRDG